MAGLSRLRLFYLLHLSKPASDRLVFREIRRLKARRVVEIGLGAGERAVHLIELMREFHELRDVHYIGLDLFEARTAADGPGISLREAHRLLKPTGARVQLVPGSVAEGFSRVANGVSQVDLVIISAGTRQEQLPRAWFFLPRMIHAQTQIFQETLAAGGNTAMRLMAPNEIESLAVQGRRRVA